MISMYDGGVADFIAFQTSLNKNVKTSAAVDEASKLASEMLVREFGGMVDERSVADPTISHAYDWDQTGNVGGRLWVATYKGRRGGREVGFEFLPSRRPVPVPERAEGPKGQQLAQTHVFHWKAAIMEYAIPTTINRKGSDWLAIPVEGDGHRNGLVFSKGPIRHTNISYHNLAFSRMWQAWWTAGGADEAFDSSVKPIIEEPWNSATLKAAMGTRSMKKTTSLRVSSTSGDAISKKFLRAVQSAYRRA